MPDLDRFIMHAALALACLILIAGFVLGLATAGLISWAAA